MRRSNFVRATLAAVVLSAAALAVDAQCISTVRIVSQPVVFPSHAAGPVAWTGSALGVVKVDKPSNVVYFATYDGDLIQLTDDRIVANATLLGPLALIWNGSEFALFYQTDALQLVFQRIAVNGDTIGGPIAVAPQHLPWPHQEFDIAWDARRNTYDIIHTIPTGVDRGLWLTTVARDGTVVFDGQISIYFATNADPRLAVAPSGEIGITWVRTDVNAESTYLMVVNAKNDVTNVVSLPPTERDARIATNGREFLIVTTPPGGDVPELRVSRFNLQGAPIGGAQTLVVARGKDIVPVNVIWNPSLGEWALLYSESILGFLNFPGETRLRRFTFTGPSSDTLFSPDPLKNIFDPASPLVWTGTSYVGSISRPVPRIEGSDTHIVKHCPLLSSISGASYAPLYGYTNFTASASGGTPDYRYQWDFGDTAKGVGRTTQHQYVKSGVYTVTLTVTDVAGAVTVTNSTITVVVAKQRAARH